MIFLVFGTIYATSHYRSRMYINLTFFRGNITNCKVEKLCRLFSKNDSPLWSPPYFLTTIFIHMVPVLGNSSPAIRIDGKITYQSIYLCINAIYEKLS